MSEAIPDRTVLQVSGPDREAFLQGLVTNDLRKLKSGAVYAALLSPQGKYLADFFLLDAGESILLDVATVLSDGLMRRLSMYKLRANVQIQKTEITVSRGLSEPPVGAVSDPRHPALGWLCYGSKVGGPQLTDWTSLRVAYLVPETGIELVPDETYILESFKGQRGGLPRPPKNRGTPGRTRGLGPDQIPVLVAREREMKGTLTARIPTRSAASIAPVLAGRVVPDAVLVSDSAKAYRKVAKALNVSLMQVPANAKHKTELRKGLAKVSVDGPAPFGSTILSDDKEAGRLLSRSGDRAIAYLRFDRATGRMKAGDAIIALVE